ncbi:translation initiation inhibitor [Methanolobus psychrophilus R15]|nr:translation initiation inhibitor [Methanolobus psychrophilus R15]
MLDELETGGVYMKMNHPPSRKSQKEVSEMSVEYINPAGLHRKPAFSQVAVVPANARTIYIGGHNSANLSGEIIGKGDMGIQARQIFKNLEIALLAAGARIEHIIKWNIYVVQGQSSRAGFEEFQRIWGSRPNPPLITVLFVVGLANLDFLIGMDAVAVAPESMG